MNEILLLEVNSVGKLLDDAAVMSSFVTPLFRVMIPASTRTPKSLGRSVGELEIINSTVFGRSSKLEYSFVYKPIGST